MKRSVAVPMFECEFKCHCGSVIGWHGPEALVTSQTGAHVHCRHCRSVWSVKRNGATLVEAGASFLLDLSAAESAEAGEGSQDYPPPMSGAQRGSESPQ